MAKMAEAKGMNVAPPSFSLNLGKCNMDETYSHYKPTWESGIPPVNSVIYGLFEEDSFDDTYPFVCKVKVELHESEYGLDGKLIKYRLLDCDDEDYITQDETLVMWRYVTLDK